MIRYVFAAVLSSLILQGCVFAPGQHMDDNETNGHSSGSSRVELIPITPKLIAMDAASYIPFSVPAALSNYVPDSYRIGANDVMYITVWDHPELTAPSGPQQQIDANGRLVRPDGTLFYPFLGNVVAAGKTIEELRAFIAKGLAQFVDRPQVDVSVLRFSSQKVVISGAVLRAGPQPLTSTPLTVIEAIGAAGVDPVNADLSTLILTRDGVSYTLDLDSLNRNDSGLNEVYLKGGDRLHLSYNDRKRIYVIGEVNQPRALTFKTRAMNLSDVLGSVGGLNQVTSNGDAVYVIRGSYDAGVAPVKIFQLQVTSPSSMALATRFDVQAQDVVYVGPANVTRWNRFISQLVPSASLIGIGAAAQNNLSEANSR